MRKRGGWRRKMRELMKRKEEYLENTLLPLNKRYVEFDEWVKEIENFAKESAISQSDWGITEEQALRVIKSFIRITSKATASGIVPYFVKDYIATLERAELRRQCIAERLKETDETAKEGGAPNPTEQTANFEKGPKNDLPEVTQGTDTSDQKLTSVGMQWRAYHPYWHKTKFNTPNSLQTPKVPVPTEISIGLFVEQCPKEPPKKYSDLYKAIEERRWKRNTIKQPEASEQKTKLKAPTPASRQASKFSAPSLMKQPKASGQAPKFSAPNSMVQPGVSGQIAKFSAPNSKVQPGASDQTAKFNVAHLTKQPEASRQAPRFSAPSSTKQSEVSRQIPRFEAPTPLDQSEASKHLQKWNATDPIEQPEACRQIRQFDAPSPMDQPEAPESLSKFDAPTPMDQSEIYGQTPKVESPNPSERLDASEQTIKFEESNSTQRLEAVTQNRASVIVTAAIRESIPVTNPPFVPLIPKVEKT